MPLRRVFFVFLVLSAYSAEQPHKKTSSLDEHPKDALENNAIKHMSFAKDLIEDSLFTKATFHDSCGPADKKRNLLHLSLEAEYAGVYFIPCHAWSFKNLLYTYNFTQKDVTCKTGHVAQRTALVHQFSSCTHH